MGGAVRTVCYVERDGFAASVLVDRMEAAELDPAPIWDDLESFDGRAWRGAVDLISAGFPCQPFSAAGKKLGTDDARWVWPDIARIVRDVGPRFVFLENVAGLVRHGLPDVLGSLAGLGFDAEWDLFTASGVGAPHRRARFFLLAERVPDPGGYGVWLGAKRGGDSARPPEPRHAVARNVGQGVADPDDARRAATERGRRDVDVSVAPGEDRGGGLADPERDRLEGHGDGPGSGVGEERGGPARTLFPLDLADPDRRRREGSGEPERSGLGSSPGLESHGLDHGGGFPRPFPPGPGDREAWARVDPEAQPALRRMADGVPGRLDRLGALGNAVVPLVAAHAFRTLAARLRA